MKKSMLALAALLMTASFAQAEGTAAPAAGAATEQPAAASTPAPKMKKKKASKKGASVQHTQNHKS